MQDCLVLSDGASFPGIGFGSPAPQVGEVALYTGVVGWQEVLTDPAYAGKIVVFTYPHVGNYGVNDEDVESSTVTVKGIVVRDLARFHSNFRARGSFRAWVEERGIAGLNGVDTRAIMVHVREHGAGVAAIARSREDGLAAIREIGSPFERNLVATVQGICRGPSKCEVRGAKCEEGDVGASSPDLHRPTPDTRHPTVRLAVLDLGGKYSLYRQMADLGCDLRFFPWDTRAEMIAASGAAGLLLPPGPGDPDRLAGVVEQVRRLVGMMPVLGIGLGFQLLSLALGARVLRLDAGRHGVNYPVCSTRGEPSLIVACHHSFAVDGASLPQGAEVTYRHLNEGTAMGLEVAGARAWGYQFHPGRDLDGLPSPLLARFVESVRAGEER